MTLTESQNQTEMFFASGPSKPVLPAVRPAHVRWSSAAVNQVLTEELSKNAQARNNVSCIIVAPATPNYVSLTTVHSACAALPDPRALFSETCMSRNRGRFRLWQVLDRLYDFLFIRLSQPKKERTKFCQSGALRSLDPGACAPRRVLNVPRMLHDADWHALRIAS